VLNDLFKIYNKLIMTTQPFPEWQDDNLTLEQVMSVLADLQNQGHTIVFGRPPIVNGWTILGTATRWVAVRPQNFTADGMWSVCVGNLGRSMGTVSSTKDLKGYLDAAMQSQGMSVTNPPTQVILEAEEPISNMAKILAIIGNSKITALWDPYLANETLICLTDLASLGAGVDPNIRILAANRTMSGPRGMIARGQLTSSFFAQFKSQTASNAEVRLGSKEHDRFMLLSDGRCISPDFSLNKVDNRGTVNEIADYASRLSWFDNEWAIATVWQ
jgi:hypothetical protein